MTVTIGNNTYEVKEARTEEQLRQGLKGIKELPKDKGMLFYFDPPREVSMTMQDTFIALDQIFINEDDEVIKVVTRKPNDEELVTVKDTAYVLEVNANSGIKKGDELDFDPVMSVLSQDGSVQMELYGGERIFRREFTKQLIGLIKKADSIRYDKHRFNKMCIRIGKKMFKEISDQDNRDTEYVSVPD